MDDLTTLLKECEADKGSEALADQIKKAKVGIINLKAYLQQVDVIEFTTAIKNEFSFKVGCKEGFGPWMDKVGIEILAQKMGYYTMNTQCI